MKSFDSIIERKGTNSEKWDALESLYGRGDLLSMWVADMDFPAAPAIVEALKKRLEHEVLGYTFLSDSYYDAVIGWMEKRHNWAIKREWIKFTPGVVPALNFAIRAFTVPGDEVIIQTPVYPPFYQAIRNNDCKIVKNPLKYSDNKYTMDYEDLEQKITSRTKLLILCNPHNPVGRVWTEEELAKLGKVCLENNIIIVSDEIHFDLIYKEYKHTVMAKISEDIAQNCIICTAPSKTFNIAGLQVSNIIIPNEELRKAYSLQLEKNALWEPNVFAGVAVEAAYNESEQWLDNLIDYINCNLKYLMDFIEKRVPKIKVVKPEGTYLVWLDCSKLNMNSKQLREFFIDKCNIALNDGEMFGEEGEKFQRINIACPRKILIEGLNRIEEAVKCL